MQKISPTNRRALAVLIGLSLLTQPFAATAQASGTAAYGYQVPLTGMNQSISQGQLTVTPATHAFGTVVIGSTVATTTQVKNTGQDAVNLTGFDLAAPYSQSNSCPSVLVGGAACNVTVTYAPTATGTHNGVLTMSTSDPSVTGTFGVSATTVPQTTNLTLSGNSVDFGATDVGGAGANKTLTIKNAGNSPATVNGIGVSGTEFNQSNNCGSVLAPGASCTLNLAFFPAAYGARSSNLSVYEQASGTLYSVALTGSGNAAVMSVSTNALTFGSAIANYSTTTAQATVYNTGNLPLNGLSLATSTPEYSVSASTCGATLAAGANCVATVRFAPTAAGPRSGTLNVFSTNGGAAAIALSGSGIAQAQAAAVSVSTLAFGNEPVDGSTAPQLLTFSNTGNVIVNLGGVNVVTGATHYALTSNCGSTLAVGASCTASVTFTPRAAGSLPGTVRATFSSGNVDIALSGTGTLAEATVNPTTLSFADQQVASTSAVKTVTVTNTGNRKLTLSGVSIIAGATNFAQSNNCLEVAPAASCTVNLTFTPTVSGPLAGMLALVHDGVNGTTTVDLSGVGRVQAAAITTPTFATTAVGSSATGTATLSNTGIGALSVTTPTAGSVTGAGYSLVSTTCGTSVAVGASCTTTVRFSPTSTAPASGTLNIITGAGTQTASFGSTGIQGFASVNPSSLSFTAQQVGSTSAAQVVTVTNTGTDALAFTGVGISAGSSDFAQSNNCGSVPVAGTCTVNVTFTPTFNATRMGTLSFTHNGGGIANVNLSGIGQAPSATLSDVSFGGVNVGSTPTLTSTLTNTGIGLLTVTPPAAGSVSSAHFSFVSTTCGSTLAAGASCSTTVRFSPATGGAKSGTLAISTGAGLLNSALTGTGNQAVLAFSSPSSTTINWGSRQVGGSYVSSLVTLTNSGNAPATSLVLTPTSVWTLASNTCGSTLNASSSCTFVMMFNPTAAQAYNGAVTASAAVSVVANQMSMTGTGQAQSATLSTPTFAATPVGSSSNADTTLTNTGIGPVSVTVPYESYVTGAGFSFVSTTCGTTLAAGATCTTTLKFSPTNTATASGTFAIDTSAGRQTVNLGSTGIQGYASMSPGSLTFGTTTVGSSSGVQTITVTNTGTNTLTFTGVGIASGGSNFGSSNNCGSVAVGGTCTVNVAFTPQTTGAISGSVGFTHNGGGIAAVTLSGTGASYSWLSGGWSTPSACGATTSTRAVSCQRNDGATVADGFCSGTKPATTQGATDYGSCSYNFQYGGWSTPAACGAVTQTRTASCLRSDGTTVPNASCGTPVTSQGATDYSTCSYSFQYSGWSTPAACGAVTQTRTASCLRSDGTTVSNAYCGTPVTSQGATDYSTCSYSWQAGGYSTPAACGATTATRSVWCRRSDGTTVGDASCGGGKPTTTTGTTDYSACGYSWQTSGWSSPSGCGAVTQTRSVWCQRSDGATVGDASCGGGKPVASQGSTDYGSCTYGFSYGGWSNPSGCGAVTQTRTASCQRSDGATVSNAYCGTPVTSQGSTNYGSCTYSFQYGGWSTPAGCGAVTQTRSASCLRSDGTTVPNGNCGTPVTSQGAADYSACSYNANIGGWSGCSNSCGAGTQTRSVSCTRSDGATVANSSCGSPATSQSCTGNTGCAPPAIVLDTYGCQFDTNYYQYELWCSGHSAAGNGYPAWSNSYDDRNTDCGSGGDVATQCRAVLQGLRGF